VINSPEVHFGIKRQHADVGQKNLFNFSHKNHLDKSIITTKQFILKNIQHDSVQFLVQKLGMT
jgi:hypothetical protein